MIHPGRIKVTEDELFQYIDKLVDYGLDGIEVYSQHNKKVKMFEDYCLDKNLLMTGGSDFHDLHLEEIGKYKGLDIPYEKVYKSICDIGRGEQKNEKNGRCGSNCGRRECNAL